MEFGELKNIAIKNIWESEHGKFTPWLSENIDKISEVIGKDLEIDQTEYPVGNFSADILATDLSTSKKVIIENQFGDSNHKHLGQIILYCAGVDANTLIWVSEKFKDEHKKTIEWLNANTLKNIEFYAIEIEIIQIDNSRPVPRFTVVVSPNKNFSGEIDSPSNELSDTQGAYKNFFQKLIDDLREKHHFTNAKAGQPQSWYSFASENSRFFKYSLSFALKERIRAEIYIDSGEQKINKELFDRLYKIKEKIEKEFGEALVWEKLDTKRASRIAIYKDGSINSDSDQLLLIHEWAIEKLLKFKKIFPKYLLNEIKTIER